MLSLVAIIIISILINYFLKPKHPFIDGNSLREWYGFAAAFSGVVGVGFILY
jgi:hypothetical protein